MPEWTDTTTHILPPRIVKTTHFDPDIIADRPSDGREEEVKYTVYADSGTVNYGKIL